MNPQMFEQMQSQFGSLFGGIDKSNMKQAENIWKMLDEMSQNNPDQYKKFVQSNIEDGFKNLEKEQKEKMEGQKVQPNIGFLIKTQANLKTQILDKEQKDIFQKLVVKEQNVNEYKEFKKKCDKEVKFYINVLCHERVKGPLNENMKVVKDFQKVHEWKIVPVSVSQVASRKSESYGTNVYFVDVVVNEKVYEFMMSQVQLEINLIKFITDRVQEEIRTHHNPLLEFFNPSEVNELLYYEFEKMSLKRHTKKRYKHVEKKYKQPQPLLIEPKYDVDYEKNQKKLRKEQNKIDDLKDKAKGINKGQPQPQFSQQQQPEPQKPMMQPEDLLKQMSGGSGNQGGLGGVGGPTGGAGGEEKVLDGLRIVDKSEVKKEEPKKPFLIQELSSTEAGSEQKEEEKEETLEERKKRVQEKLKKEAEKQIQEQKKEEEEKVKVPVYSLEDRDTFYVKIEIQLPLVKSFKQINLDISSKELKLNVVDVYDLNIQFDCPVDNDDIQAKWEKKSKVLKLTIAKLN